MEFEAAMLRSSSRDSLDAACSVVFSALDGPARGRLLAKVIWVSRQERAQVYWQANSPHHSSSPVEPFYAALSTHVGLLLWTI